MMKIAVCGKGGSGKSTVVAILAGEFQGRGNRVLVVDADESNSGLHWMLGFDEPPIPLMDFVGGKKSIQSKISAGFATGKEETDMSIWSWKEIPSANIPSENVSASGKCRLVVTGKINRVLEGCACPMGIVTREFLKKLRLANNEIAVVDMEAGIEHFGRGIETSLDAVVVVVEPSLESLSLAQKIKELTCWAGAHFAGAVLNKINSDTMLSQLTGALVRRDIRILGSISYHQQLLSAALEGRALDLGSNGDEVTKIADNILGLVLKFDLAHGVQIP